MSWEKHFQPASDDLFFKSQKTGDPRFGEVSRSYSGSTPEPGTFILAGYPDDEGIHLNSGRVGAALGPDSIRSRLYKTSTTEFHKSTKLVDFGNLDTSIELKERHQTVKEAVCQTLTNQCRWIGLGGGHDYGYPDGAGFLLANANSKLKPLILNFDAHLDVRPLDKGLSSGTPFYRLLTEDGLPEFDFYEIGIQRQCNSQSHIDWAQEKGARVLFFEDMMMSGEALHQQILAPLSELMVKKRPTYISMDIDCFSTAYAMGCSQAWPTGFSPNDLFPVLNILFNRMDVQVLGVYEVSPPLDQDERTVKLATQIVHQFLGPLA